MGNTPGIREILNLGIEKASRITKEPLRGFSSLIENMIVGGLPPQLRLSLERTAAITGAKKRCDLEFDLLKEIAMTQAEINDVTGAKKTVHLIEDKQKKFTVLGEIVAIQVKNGSMDEVKSTFCLIEDQYQQHVVLRRIAVAQSENRDVGGAKETIDSIGDLYQKSVALRGVAVVQAKNEDVDEAKVTFREAQKEALLIDDPELKFRALIEIGKDQDQNKDIDGAKETFAIAETEACLTANQKEKFDRLKEIALARAKNDVESAIVTARLINNTHCESQTLIDIAGIQFRNKDKDGAKKTLATVTEKACSLEANDKDSLLLHIMGMQIRNNDREGAEKTVSLMENQDKGHVLIEQIIKDTDGDEERQFNWEKRRRLIKDAVEFAQNGKMAEVKNIIMEARKTSPSHAIFIVTEVLEKAFQKSHFKSRSRKV